MTETFHFDSTPKVVTGQQAGLFGGPLYTLYKLLGALVLAETRGERAVFWIECDDADIREADRATLVDGEGAIASISSEEPDDGRPVAARILAAGVERALSEVAARIPSDPHGAVATLGEVYRPGRRWAEAFALYLDRIVGAGRATFLDPTNLDAKRRALPLFLRVLDDRDAVDRALAAGAASVADPAVAYRPGEIPLFVLDDGGVRRKLERRDPGFALKGEAHARSAAELRELFEQSPQRVSPGVLLRPLVQDYLLHTSCYVAGPSEIRYHAQLGPLYQRLDVPRPQVVARPRFTLLEPRTRRALTKLGVTAEVAAAGEAALRAAIAKRSGHDPTLPLATALTAVEGALAALREAITPIEPQAMTQAADEATTKIRYQLDKLGQRATTALARRDGTLNAAVERVLTLLLPEGKPQERVLAPVHFLARTDPTTFISTLLAAIDARDLGRHQFLTIE